MQSKNSRIKELIGLKGLAASIVVLNHYVLAFYPNLMDKGSIGKALVHTPLNIIYNGNFAVCMFFVISGFLLSYKFFMYDDEDSIRSTAVRRYLRLMIPMLISILICYIMMKSNVLFHIEAANFTESKWLESHYNFNPNIIDAIQQAFFGIFLGKSATYNSVLWTMFYELWGSFLTLSIISIFKKSKNRFIIYMILSIVFCNTYFLAFILGIVICDFTTSEIKKEFEISFPYKMILLLIGIWLSSYNGARIYNFMHVSFINDYSAFYHSLGAALLVYITLNSSFLRNVCCSKYIMILGNYSATIYYFHWIILNSLSCYLFINFLSYFEYYQSFILSFTLSIFTNLIISKIFVRVVEKFPNELSTNIYKKYFC